jgi:hypothetical protein
MAAPGWWREPPANATYHPGVKERYQAEAVSLKEGERRADVDFRVERPTRLTISGTVVFSNGTPAAEVDVRLVSEGGVTISPTRTNTSGEFMLTGFSGSTYAVRATFYRSPENNGSAEQTIALGAEPVTGLELVLRRRTR